MTVPGELFLEGDVYNEQSLKEVSGFAEAASATLKLGDIVQFPRFGFCRLDAPGRFVMTG